MEAGQSTRQHSDLALLYPRSKSLQTYIIEFFIVVVQICLRYHRYSQKSALGKFTSSLNDSDIKEARSNLLFWSKSIQSEMTTLIAKAIEAEAQSNSRFRAVMNLSSKSASQQRNQIIFRNTLDRCATHDYETTWRQIRKAGNTSLYAQMPEYVQWATGPDPKTLILVGKLGYGKSVTLANVVDDLSLRIDPVVSGLAYFFCRHDVPESLLARTVVGSLVRQIISPFPQRLVETEVFDTYRFNQLLNLVRSVVPPNYTMYVVLDGLDLCSSSERREITEKLEAMRVHFNIHTCVSLRLEPEAELQSLATEFSEAEAVRLPDNTSDIGAFVTAQLEVALSEQSLVLGDPSIILDIQNALVQGSEHMFLWVALQIKSLCAMQTDHDIREALADLPRDLSQIYSRILQKSSRPDKPLQSDIFKLILSAKKPLSADEMREALSVTPGDTTWNPAKRLNNIYPALATCGCLVTVDEEELTIRTVHPSVNQFLLRDDSTPSDNSQQNCFSLKDAQTLMSSIIVTYLSYGMFGTQVAIRSPPLNVGSAPSQIIKATTHTQKSVQSVALKLLRSTKRADFDISKSLAHESKRHISSTVEDHQFQHYAKKYVLLHFTDLPRMSCSIPDGLIRMFEQGTIRFREREEIDGLFWLMLQQSSSQWDIEILTKHIDSWVMGQLRRSVSKILGVVIPRLFYRAIEIGSIHMVNYLFGTFYGYGEGFHGYGEGFHGYRVDEIGRTAIRIFCYFYLGWESSRRGSRDLFGSAPLCHAISNSQDLVAELLILHEAIDFNKSEDIECHDEWTRPIGMAVRRGYTGVVNQLLSKDRGERLWLECREAYSLLEFADTLSDSSIKWLLRDYMVRTRIS
jgi:hypothetical protein